ncbi:unnamed protein product [Didymodactylos carnosus]|uniref:Uncharacterized protein n=2 Tax=Didymodactylos carnosus TaxID=1234261 RepID=A0A815YDP7_9BILA|nr:unnamed protein product [Didymodactylos carnosus]CAF4432011.1 unnamed protein product [Didymodactylos carnosus]
MDWSLKWADNENHRFTTSKKSITDDDIVIGQQDMVKLVWSITNRDPYFQKIKLKEKMQIIIRLHNPVNEDTIYNNAGNKKQLSFTFEELKLVLSHCLRDLVDRISIIDSSPVVFAPDKHRKFDVSNDKWMAMFNENIKPLLLDDSIKYLIVCGASASERLEKTKAIVCGIYEDKSKVRDVHKCIYKGGKYPRVFYVIFTTHPSADAINGAIPNRVRYELYQALNYYYYYINKKEAERNTQ